MLNKCIRRYFFASRAKEAKKQKKEKKISPDLRLISLAPWAPKVGRKCESKHWYACGTDGRSLGRAVGVRSRDYQIFSDG